MNPRTKLWIEFFGYIFVILIGVNMFWQGVDWFQKEQNNWWYVVWSALGFLVTMNGIAHVSQTWKEL